MDEQQLDRVVTWAERLPASDVRALADALAGGTDGLRRLKGTSASPVVRAACDDLHDVLRDGGQGDIAAGVLLGALALKRRTSGQSSIDVVWTGPFSDVETSRLTSAVVTGLIAEAQHELLLIGYAVHTEPSVAEALGEARQRGVEASLLLERDVDNPKYSVTGAAFPQLDARRLAWPAAQRPAGGAALHAKVLVIDRRTALVGSANITGWALGRNLECGLLVRDQRVAAAICAHVEGLLEQSTLVRI